MIELNTLKEVYHVHRRLPYNLYEDLAAGAELKSGEKFNPFFSFYEHARTYSVVENGIRKSVPAIRFLKLVAAKSVKCDNFPQIAIEIAEHYLMLSREILLEQQRIIVQPDAPSRNSCLWVVKSMDQAIYWKSRLGKDGAILKLNARGNFFEADASLILADSEPLSETLKKAELYWQGVRSEKPELETLFSGEATVEQCWID